MTVLILFAAVLLFNTIFIFIFWDKGFSLLNKNYITSEQAELPSLSSYGSYGCVLYDFDPALGTKHK